MKLTRYGKREWRAATVLALILLAVCIALAFFVDLPVGGCLAVLVAVLWLGFIAFFRDPVRKIPGGEENLVSPADGVIRDCELIPGGSCGNPKLAKLFAGKDMLRIGIFLSVLDVHVNRIPCKFTVQFIDHRPGAYHDARDPRGARENESLLMGGTGELAGKKFPVAVKQIAGSIARRIVCEAVVGDVLDKGACYGMIKFGSRTELYLPVKSRFEPAIAIGDHVYGGSTVIARRHEKLS